MQPLGHHSTCPSCKFNSLLPFLSVSSFSTIKTCQSLDATSCKCGSISSLKFSHRCPSRCGVWRGSLVWWHSVTCFEWFNICKWIQPLTCTTKSHSMITWKMYSNKLLSWQHISIATALSRKILVYEYVRSTNLTSTPHDLGVLVRWTWQCTDVVGLFETVKE